MPLFSGSTSVLSYLNTSGVPLPIDKHSYRRLYPIYDDHIQVLYLFSKSDSEADGACVLSSIEHPVGPASSTQNRSSPVARHGLPALFGSKMTSPVIHRRTTLRSKARKKKGRSYGGLRRVREKASPLTCSRRKEGGKGLPFSEHFPIPVVIDGVEWIPKGKKALFRSSNESLKRVNSP